MWHLPFESLSSVASPSRGHFAHGFMFFRTSPQDSLKLMQDHLKVSSQPAGTRLTSVFADELLLLNGDMKKPGCGGWLMLSLQ